MDGYPLAASAAVKFFGAAVLFAAIGIPLLINAIGADDEIGLTYSFILVGSALSMVFLGWVETEPPERRMVPFWILFGMAVAGFGLWVAWVFISHHRRQRRKP